VQLKKLSNFSQSPSLGYVVAAAAAPFRAARATEFKDGEPLRKNLYQNMGRLTTLLLC
jgi:hypothetical protein